VKVVFFSRYPENLIHPKGGIESVAVVLVKAIAQLGGLDVHVVTLEYSKDRIEVERYENVTVHRLPRSRCPEMLDIFVGPGRRRLIKYIRKLKPDVLHTHETYGLALGGISIPHVFTVHGFDHANLLSDSARLAWIRSRLWRFVERRGLSTQKHIISITPYVRMMIEHLTSANIYEIDNPVDERFFKIKHQPEPGRILCVGWISERKNTLKAIEAFTPIARNYDKAKLVIAGEPKEADYFNRIKKFIHNMKLSDRVDFLGHINHKRLEQELARACIFLLPSRQENSPMAIAEAMAAGIPVIASNRCGMPYMVEERETGFLIDPESTNQIADRLAQLLVSDKLCRKMGETARRVAMKRFHPSAVALRTRAVYETICASTKKVTHN